MPCSCCFIGTTFNGANGLFVGDPFNGGTMTFQPDDNTPDCCAVGNYQGPDGYRIQVVIRCEGTELVVYLSMWANGTLVEDLVEEMRVPGPVDCSNLNLTVDLFGLTGNPTLKLKITGPTYGVGGG